MKSLLVITLLMFSPAIAQQRCEPLFLEQNQVIDELARLHVDIETNGSSLVRRTLNRELRKKRREAEKAQLDLSGLNTRITQLREERDAKSQNEEAKKNETRKTEKRLLRTLQPKALLDTKDIYHFRFSPDDKFIIAKNAHEQTFIFNSDTGKRVGFGFIDTPEYVALSNNKILRISANRDQRTLQVIDIYKKTLEAEFPISAKNPLLGAMTPDARLAITGFNEGSDAGEVVLWDLANKKYLGKLIEAAVVDFNFSADGNKVIVLSQDGKTGPYNVAVFDTQTLAKIHEHNFYPSDFVTHCRLNSHGTQAVLELGQNEMLVWDLALDQVGPRFNGRAANHTASHYIGFSNTETPTGTRHQLELYKLGENDPIASYTNDLGMSGNVAVSAHGSHVVMKYGEKTQIFELSEDDEL